LFLDSSGISKCTAANNYIPNGTLLRYDTGRVYTNHGGGVIILAGNGEVNTFNGSAQGRYYYLSKIFATKI
jgi:hypothetical protein